MKEELKNIIQNDYNITYKDEMTMEELVNEINKSNINLALSINSATKVLLNEFVKDLKKDNEAFKTEIKTEILNINSKIDKILQKLDIQ